MGLCGTIFLFLLVSLSVVERGTATYVIVVVDLLSVTLIGIVTGAILFICRGNE
jgi:hypothetical protein